MLIVVLVGDWVWGWMCEECFRKKTDVRKIKFVRGSLDIPKEENGGYVSNFSLKFKFDFQL